MSEPTSEASPIKSKQTRADRIHKYALITMQSIMTLELAAVLFRGEWFTAFLVVAIIVATLSPVILGRRFQVYIPPEFQVMAVAFVFATLFLGELRHFYVRIWWWDIALHTSSGFLLGILGFLLVYILNENANIELTMRPRFVAFFAFVFAVAIGAIWEIFEFTMDQCLGLQMQKPMFNDPSGLTDTMWDLIVDTLGALVISLLGLRFMTTKTRSFIESGIHSFIERNPRFFKSS